MSTFLGRIGRISVILFLISQFAYGNIDSDLKQSDARGVALEMIEAAEYRFECELEEHSMKVLGSGDDTRYLFRLSTVGDDCDDALLYLTNLAARKDRIIFRALEMPSPPANERPIPGNQDLIHEVDPK